MEEELIKLCNIMPVELAIKRELEYRKKLELLVNQHQNDLNPLTHAHVTNPLLHAQALVSEGQTLVDRKRKEPASNAQCSRPPQSSRSFRSSPRFVCVVCRIAFATVFHLKIHGETFAHKDKLGSSKRGGANTSNPFYCEVCDILCSSSRVMEYHVAGLKHATYLQEFEHAIRVRTNGNLPSN